MANKDRATLLSDLSARFPDNASGLITPAVMRAQQTDIIDSLWNLISDADERFYSEVSDFTPTTLTVAQGEVTILSFSDTMPAGEYSLTGSLVTAFVSTNDRVAWRYTGDSVSSAFHAESKDANDVIPWTLVLPFSHAGGVFNSNLLVQALNDDVEITASSIMLQRVG